MNKIMKRLEEHYKEVENMGYEIVGLFLQGSQNYKLSYENSDIDSKAIILPKFNDFVLGNKMVSTTHILENNEHIDIKDIRLMFDCFKKQNINFVEILFTKYKIINPKYELYIQALFDNNEFIARYNNYATVNCISGTSMEKYKALEHPYPSLIEKIEEFGYDCYSDDTKFLTENGWKYYCDIKDGEKIGTFNRIIKELEFQNFYDRFCKTYNGIMYNVETYNSCFRVTPNHKIYTSSVADINTNGHSYKEELANWKLESIGDIMNIKYSKTHSSKHRHLATITNNNVDLQKYDEIEITDDLLKLLGAFVSDGTIGFRNGKVKNIQITQKDCDTKHNSEFIKMIRNISTIKINEYSYPARNGNNNELIWCMTNEEIRCNFFAWCGHGSKEKRLPNFIYLLSIRQANILLDSLCLGDGTDQKTRRVYYTISRQLADDVQVLSILAGKYAVVMGGEDGYDNKDNFNNKLFKIHQVAIKKELYTPNWCYFKLGKNVTEQNYCGKVVCFSVPNSILITQRKGKIAIQGNSKQLHHIIRLNEFIKRYLAGEKYADCLISNNKDYLITVKRSIHTLEEAREIAKRLSDETHKIKTEYMKYTPLQVNKECEDILNTVLLNIMKHNFKCELSEV